MNEAREKWKRAVVIFLKDLSLLASVYLAQFIVWRILRRERRERAARLKHIKLVRDA